MESKLTYNDLELLLTDEDKQQIRGIPMPSIEQAKMLVKQWNKHYGNNICAKEPADVLNGIIIIKPYLKIKYEMPECLV